MKDPKGLKLGTLIEAAWCDKGRASYFCGNTGDLRDGVALKDMVAEYENGSGRKTIVGGDTMLVLHGMVVPPEEEWTALK